MHQGAPVGGHDPYAGPHDPYAPGPPDGGVPLRRRRRRRWPKVLGAVFVVLVLLVVGGYFYLDSRLKREDVLTDYAGRVADTPGTNWLIVGSDSREGLSRDQENDLATGHAEGRRTDSMMLLHYGSGGTSLISLPRDSYVPIPGHGSNKLNASFAFGGPKLLVQTVEMATRVHIDHYAEIGFGGFVGVVDAIGGVKICVKERMKDPKAGLDLQPGCQNLNGKQALGYVRTRKFARADLERVEHQRQFFGALMKKATSPGVMLNPFDSIPLALHATSNFRVDNNDHLYDLIRMMWAMRGVTGGDGVTTTIPIGGTGSSASAGSYITWDKTRSGQLFDALRQDKPIPQNVITK
ncbi:LCP family protein [Actinomadura rupiterrae]|uniref:LCP family protein n=1 Tax=Actinomadura rupiterrae TaxID=559627 RepID=UPI0020A320C3|nr:LCP family protein [Actinomadura rupiterrae]MCP2336236.1 LCP family protein required for cell wall assembly [Actinomadura rupiterrae]